MSDQVRSRDYFARAKWYMTQIDSIIQIVEGKSMLSPQERQKVQDFMKTLKGRLEQDFKFCRSIRRFQAMTEEEKHFYEAVVSVHTNFKVRLNSDPIKFDWQGQLSKAANEFETYMDYLQWI